MNINTVLGNCKFDEYKGKLYTGLTGQTHKASGPKCKFLCDDDPNCVSASVRMIRGQGMLCELMNDAPGDVTALTNDPDVVLYVKKGNLLNQPDFIR